MVSIKEHIICISSGKHKRAHLGPISIKEHIIILLGGEPMNHTTLSHNYSYKRPFLVSHNYSYFFNIDSYVNFLKKLRRLVLLYGTVLFRYVYGTHGTPILQGVGGIKLRRDNLIPRNNGCNHWIQRKI